MSADELDLERLGRMGLMELVDVLEADWQDRGWDYGVRLEVAAECAWSAEVRVTPNPNDPEISDLSYVAFAAGGETPEDALLRAVSDVTAWMFLEGKERGEVTA